MSLEPTFNANILTDYRMQWALNNRMVINSKYQIHVNAYKLASRSELFKNLLRLNGKNDDFHYQTDRLGDLELVIRFCHIGQCDIDCDNLELLLRISYDYKITELTDICDRFIESSVNNETSWTLWILVNRYDSLKSKLTVDNYVLKNLISSSSAATFQQLTVEQLLCLLTDDRLNVHDEYQLIDVIGRWIDHNTLKRANQIGRLITGVRLGLLTLDQIETLWKNQIIKRTQSNDCLTNIRQVRRFLFRNKRNLRPLSKCGNTNSGDSTDQNYKCRPRLPHEAIFVFGGWEAGTASRAVRVFDSRSQLWVSYTSGKDNNPLVLPRPLMSFGITLFQQTQVFILGGEIRQHQATQEVICYDFLQHKWINKAPMHEIRRDLAVVNLNDDVIFAIGGDNNKTVLDSVEKFIPSRNQWIEVTPMLMMRSAPAADALNGKLYVLGGYTESQMEALTASCELYDPLIDQWTFIKAMSQQRYYFNALTHDGYMYVIGGGDENQWSTVERYSPANDIWSPMPSLLQQRADFATCVLDGEFYCLGGGGDSFCTAEVERWRPDDIEHGWQRSVNLPTPTWGHRCVCVKGVNTILPYLKHENASGISTQSIEECIEVINDTIQYDDWNASVVIESMQDGEQTEPMIG